MYTRKEAAQRARESVGRPNVIGMCQAFTRGIFGQDAVGDVDGDGDADAVDGWKSEPLSARHTGPAPEGVPGAWSGGSRGFGHRATSIGNDRWVSTDAPVTGRIGVVNTAWFKENWGMDYLGWSTTMSGEPIPNDQEPKVKYAFLEAMSWNVYVGNHPSKVRANLVKFINRHNPDVIYLYEALHLFGNLEGLGYRVLQLKPRATKPGRASNNGNIVCLVRNGLEIKTSKIARMSRAWKGPRLGKPQDPRVFRVIKVKKQGVVWKVAGVHFPFGRARVEAVNFVRNLIKVTSPKRPVIVLGDFNFNEKNVTENIAKPAGAEVAGERIDLAVYANCDLVSEKNLGKGVSDHPMWRYVFKKRRPRRKK